MCRSSLLRKPILEVVIHTVKFFFSKPSMTTLLVCGWLTVAGFGVWQLSAYSLAPGPQGIAPTCWPVAAINAREPGAFTAVVALHPECPCSQATLEELDSIVAQSGGRLHPLVLLVELPGLPSPEDSALWHRARRITGVRLVKDRDGAEARRFGARTSGETRLYGPDGRLLFHGGITAARGHVGDNAGQAAIASLLLRPGTDETPRSSPVFGCALENDHSKPST